MSDTPAGPTAPEHTGGTALAGASSAEATTDAGHTGGQGRGNELTSSGGLSLPPHCSSCGYPCCGAESTHLEHGGVPWMRAGADVYVTGLGGDPPADEISRDLARAIIDAHAARAAGIRPVLPPSRGSALEDDVPHFRVVDD